MLAEVAGPDQRAAKKMRPGHCTKKIHPIKTAGPKSVYYGLYGEATPWATQWPIQGKARKKILESVLLPPYLKVWIRHWYR